MRRFLLFSLLVVGWLLLAAPPVFADPMTLCVVERNAPFAFHNADNELVGFDVDMWEAMGLTQSFSYRGTDFPTALAGLADNSCDMVLSNISITPERARRFLFSVPYMKTGLGIMLRSGDSNIRNRQDLNGRTIVVSKASTAEQYIFTTNKGGVVLALSQETSRVDALLSGQADAIVGDLPQLQGYVRYRGDNRLVVLDEVFALQDYAYAFARNRETLKKAVDAALQRMLRDGTVDRLCEKWFGYKPSAAADDAAAPPQ